MRGAWFAILATLCLTLAGVSQTQPAAKPGGPQAKVKVSPLIPYAGNWVGTFENKPWFMLNLSLTGEQFSGSLQHARDLELNDNGELKKVGEEFSTQTVVDGKLNPDGLLLTLKDPDTQDTYRYLLKLTSDTTAEIKMLGMPLPPGLPKPKPWRLTKAGAPSTKP